MRCWRSLELYDWHHTLLISVGRFSRDNPQKSVHNWTDDVTVVNRVISWVIKSTPGTMCMFGEPHVYLSY